MLWLFHVLTDRLKALFVADVASDFEAQLLSRDAERKADLLRQAQRYEDEGLIGIADHLRQQAQVLNVQRPLASVLPAIEHLQESPLEPYSLIDQSVNSQTAQPQTNTPRLPNPKKRKSGET